MAHILLTYLNPPTNTHPPTTHHHPPTNPPQVVSRAHRMGATQPVHVEILAMANTAEHVGGGGGAEVGVRGVGMGDGGGCN